MPITRRDFIATGATAAAGLALSRPSGAEMLSAPGPRDAALRSPALPVVIASANGLRGVKVAFDMLAQGKDTLDAIIAGVNIQELDPNDQSVGLGGLPNEEGVVQLDASCMHGPTKRAGAVGALEGIATPSLVAKAVMDYTDEILLVGDDAKRFALAMGFKEQNLLTDASRRRWEQWKASRATAGDAWIDDQARQRWLRWKAAHASGDDTGAYEDAVGPDEGIAWTHGTINMNAVAANGDISSVTTTSGISWKIPGRVGDSPIIGAGQYCDNEVGAAGSTGRGESNIKVCGAFLTVEFMRQGKSPQDAVLAVIKRVIESTEQRLLSPEGHPYFGLDFYALNKKGEFAAASYFSGSRYAVCDAQGPRLVDSAYLVKGPPPRPPTH
jgi:N4-(beta-N-acetylglucosaminyl)-L-asparaginase